MWSYGLFQISHRYHILRFVIYPCECHIDRLWNLSRQINSLSQKTTTLSLNAVKNLSLHNEDVSKNSSIEIQPMNNRLLRNKRSVAVKNHNATFQVEFTDSQEFMDETLPRRSKRHKASASCNAISA